MEIKGTQELTLLDSLPGMAYRCIFEKSLPLLQVNAFAVDLTGFTSEQLLNTHTSLSTLIFADDQERVNAERIQALKSFGSYDLEYRLVTADGQIKYVHDQGAVCELQGRQLLNGFIVDVTKRIKSQKQRRAAEQAVLSTALSPHLAEGNVLEVAKIVAWHLVNILRLDQAGFWLFNEEKDQLHLICQVEVNKTGFHEGIIFSANDYPIYFKALKESYVIDAHDAYQDARTQEFSIGYLPSTGVVSLLDSTIRVGGEVIGVLCCEQKTIQRIWRDGEMAFASQMADQMAQTLNNQKRISAERKVLQSEARSQAKSQFFANMSHEIRTPMNGVLGMASVLQLSELNEEQKNQVRIIEESGSLLLNIIDEILDFSKLEAGKLTIDESPTQVVRLFDSVMDLLLPTIKNAISLSIDIDKNLPKELMLDNQRLRQVIINLVANAIKFTNSGSVSVDVVVVDHKHWQFSVSDTGMGIEPRLLTRLFEPFERSESARQVVGAGLGLAICKRLVSLMGGNITVSSELNKGSTFTVILPLKYVEHPLQENKIINIDNRQFTHIKVLVAEDNLTNQAVIKGLLQQLGIVPDIVNNGVEAVNAITKDKKCYDIVLMDCEMPIMDGYTATAEIKRILGDNIMPIAALTAHAFVENKEQAFKSGMHYYLTKPVKLDQLRELIALLVAASDKVDCKDRSHLSLNDFNEPH